MNDNQPQIQTVVTENTVSLTTSVEQVPQLQTVIQNGEVQVVSQVEAPFVQVTSVNGKTGDVFVSSVVSSFQPNTKYDKGSLVTHNGQLLVAKNNFTSGSSFSSSDWESVSAQQSQADWSQTSTSDPSYIKNKPSNLTNVDISSGQTDNKLVSGATLKSELDKKLNSTHSQDENGHSVATTTRNGFMSKQDKANLDSNIQKTSQNTTKITQLESTKAPSVHTHNIGDVNNLQTLLDQKASSSHRHNNATTTQDGFMSKEDKTKLDGIAPGGGGGGSVTYPVMTNSDVDNGGTTPKVITGNVARYITTKALVKSVAGKTGAVSLTKQDVGLSNVDNTSDLNKPISTATQQALNSKASTSHSHAFSQITGTVGSSQLPKASRYTLGGIKVGDNLSVDDSGVLSAKSGVDVSVIDNTLLLPETPQANSEKVFLLTKTSPISQLLDMFYPVGSYYHTSDWRFNPNDSWGGNWELDNDGTVLVSKSGVSSSIFHRDLLTKVGSEKHKLTAAEMPRHRHGPQRTHADEWGIGGDRWTINEPRSGYPIVFGGDEVGGDQPHNNVQPSKVVNRWHRIS